MSLFFKRSPSSILVRGSENVVFDVPWFTCHLVDGTQVILVRSSSPKDWEPTWVSGRVHFFAPSSLDCKVELTAFLLLLFFLFEEVRRAAPTTSPSSRPRPSVQVSFKFPSSPVSPCLSVCVVCPSRDIEDDRRQRRRVGPQTHPRRRRRRRRRRDFSV